MMRREKGSRLGRDDQDFHIRSAHPADLEKIGVLDAAVFGALAYPYFVLRQLFDVHHDCWLVADNSEGLLGYSLGVPTMDRKTGWLLGLGVREDHRRRGYGRSLTLSSLRLLRASGVGEVRLTVEPDNVPATALYRAIGFVARELHHDYLGAGEDRVIMTLPL